jgi:RNA polymerase subunit RPABC4/transcription elongation factor Spt4
MFRVITGMVLMMAGGMKHVGAKGWAGSGIVLDPEKARKDVEPWSRMGGGVEQDALSEVEVVKKIEDRLDSPAPQVKVRCRKCQTLNDETAKFCNQCGSSI